MKQITASRVALPGPAPHRFWLLQANPEKFRIDDSLQALLEDDWEIRQYSSQVHAGDRVYIWRSGSRAGVIASGWIVDEPERRPPDSGTEFWVDPWEGKQLEVRALVAYDRLFAEPVPRRDMQYHPLLRGISILRNPRGTVFPLTREQAEAIESYREEIEELTRRPGTATASPGPIASPGSPAAAEGAAAEGTGPAPTTPVRPGPPPTTVRRALELARRPTRPQRRQGR